MGETPERAERGAAHAGAPRRQEGLHPPADVRLEIEVQELLPHVDQIPVDALEPGEALVEERTGLEAGEALERADAGQRGLAAVWPDALDTIRVCIDQQAARLNCGRCLECARTLLELRAAGLRRAPASFPDPPSLRELMRLRLRIDDFFFPDLLREARAAGDPELVRAVEVLMGLRLSGPRLLDSVQRAFAPRGWRRAKRWLRRQFGRSRPDFGRRASLPMEGGGEWIG